MIKCPNCGSTAQVKFLGINKSYGAGGAWNEYHNYKCGCGTEFFEGLGYDDTATLWHRSVHITKNGGSNNDKKGYHLFFT